MTARNIEQKVRSDLGQSQEYVDERTAWVKVQRQQAELKLATMRAELAPVGLLSVGLSAAASYLRQHLLAIPPAVALQCVGKTAVEIDGVMTRAIRHALESLDEKAIADLIQEACTR